MSKSFFGPEKRGAVLAAEKSRVRPFDSAQDALAGLTGLLHAETPQVHWAVAQIEGAGSSLLYSTSLDPEHQPGRPFHAVDGAPRRPLLRADGSVLGVLCALSSATLTAPQEHLLDTLARATSTLLSGYLKEERTRQQRKVVVAGLDEATQLGGEHAWATAIAQEEAALSVLGQNALVLLVELPELKEVTVQFGEKTRGSFLRKAAKVLTGQFREHDVLCRVGEDRFGVLVRGVVGDEACAVPARIQAALERAHFAVRVGHSTRHASGTLFAAQSAAAAALDKGAPRAQLLQPLEFGLG